MQLTPTPDQWTVIDKVVRYALFPALGWFFRSMVHSLRDTVNEVITANTNRIRDELAKLIDVKLVTQESILNSYVDKKFAEHEDNAFSRIERLEETTTALSRSVKDIIRITNEIRAAQEVKQKDDLRTRTAT